MFRRKNQIELLCRISGVHYSSGNGTLHQVSVTGLPGRHAAITVDYEKGHNWTKFTCTLPLRFPLGSTPDRLFARAMMRSIGLAHSHWLLDIAERCDAIFYLHTQIPTHWLTAGVFRDVCEEMEREVTGFHQELRDRLTREGIGGNAAATATQADPGGPDGWLATFRDGEARHG